MSSWVHGFFALQDLLFSTFGHTLFMFLSVQLFNLLLKILNIVTNLITVA